MIYRHLTHLKFIILKNEFSTIISSMIFATTKFDIWKMFILAKQIQWNMLQFYFQYNSNSTGNWRSNKDYMNMACRAEDPDPDS